ncbi:hypothetical protein D3C75_1155250 [compost metagenome]
MKRVGLIALIPQKPWQARKLAVSKAGGHRQCTNRIDRSIAHKLGIGSITRTNLLVNMGKIKAFSGQTVQHRCQLLPVQ